MVILDVFIKAFHSAKGEEAKWYDVARKSFYVDNLLLSVDTLKEAVLVYKLTTSKLATIGMNLRKWVSNDDDFIKIVPKKKTTGHTVLFMFLVFFGIEKRTPFH